jgi:uncharacterized OsmC-like protein
MSDDKVDLVRSSSGGVIGRARNEARGVGVFFDSSGRPQPDALTNSEAFLGAISSCGVTLVEMHAEKIGVPLRRLAVTIEGVRPAADPARFSGVTMTFELAGVTEAQAAELVAAYRRG